MSSHTLIAQALTSHAPLVAKVGAAIRPDLGQLADGDQYVVFKRTDLIKHRGLGGQLHATQEIFDVECWAPSRDASSRLADIVISALEAAGLEPEQGQEDGIEPELLERVTVISVEVWT